MPYRIIEIEVTAPLSPVALGQRENGVAVLLRRKGRPVAFWMEARRRGTRIEEEEVSHLIAEHAGERLLAENIREELRALTPKDLASESQALPSVCIAVCTKDRAAMLERCVRSILAMDRGDKGMQAEILVVDNAPSDDATRDVVGSLSGVRYACEPKPGLDFARNCALRECRSDFLAFLDDDVVADRGWLLGLAEAWRENPDAGAFTGLVLPLELRSRAQILFETSGGFGRGFEKIRYGQTRAGNPLYPCGAGMFGAGANMVVRRDVLQGLNGFDEALDTGRPLPGGGDLDIFYRVIRAGHPLVYEPNCAVFHQHRRDSASLQRQYWSWGLGFMAFVAKCWETDPSQRSKLRALVVWWFKNQLRQLAKSALRRHVLPFPMLWAELQGGITGLLGEYGRSKERIAAINRRFDEERDRAS